MTILLFGDELTIDDMKDLGWDETAISIGLQADVSFVVAIDDERYEYNITRHLKFAATYERLVDLTFRGKKRAFVITVWN